MDGQNDWIFDLAEDLVDKVCGLAPFSHQEQTQLQLDFVTKIRQRYEHHQARIHAGAKEKLKRRFGLVEKETPKEDKK